MISFGIGSNYVRSQRVTSIFSLMIFQIMILVVLCLYEFTERFKKIYVLYLMMVLSGIAQVRGVHIFVKKATFYHKTPQITRNLTNITFVFYGINLGLIPIAFIPQIGARCSEGKEYPICFILYLIVSILFFIFAVTLFCKDYFVDKEKANEIDSVQDQLIASLVDEQK